VPGLEKALVPGLQGARLSWVAWARQLLLLLLLLFLVVVVECLTPAPHSISLECKHRW
jgi:uncharacterized integral membrane protein